MTTPQRYRDFIGIAVLVCSVIGLFVLYPHLKQSPKEPVPVVARAELKGYVVQIGAFIKQEHIDAQINRARTLGFNPYTKTVGGGKNVLTVIRIGPFNNINAALAAEKFLQDNNIDTFIMRID